MLAAGGLHSLRGRRLPDSVHVGVVAFLVTITTWVPSALLGVAWSGAGSTASRSARPPLTGLSDTLCANITTFADTLFAAAALESGATGTIVVTTIILATGGALLILGLPYRPYLRAIHWAARRITR